MRPSQIGPVTHEAFIGPLDQAQLRGRQVQIGAVVVNGLIALEQLRIEHQAVIEGGQLGLPLRFELIDPVVRKVRGLHAPKGLKPVHLAAGQHHRLMHILEGGRRGIVAHGLNLLLHISHGLGKGRWKLFSIEPVPSGNPLEGTGPLSG